MASEPIPVPTAQDERPHVEVLLDEITRLQSQLQWSAGILQGVAAGLMTLSSWVVEQQNLTHPGALFQLFKEKLIELNLWVVAPKSATPAAPESLLVVASSVPAV